MLYVLEVLDGVRCVPLCMLEAVEGALCLLEVPEVMRCMPLYTGGRGGRTHIFNAF